LQIHYTIIQYVCITCMVFTGQGKIGSYYSQL